ncbi:PREDICTED: 5' exonuclease Apollo-like, partial [Apaloderma vittatum]|uniref:5' exonuclease Apollo-like n=1 Tax=Apaloderma vittatum TaxID=57397 RepID=UPI0005216D8B
FTTEEGVGWIRAEDVANIRADTLTSWNLLQPTIAIIPTGRPVKVTHPKIHLVPYSDHSSFSELCEFVQWLKPCSVIPILKGDASQVYFQKYLSSAPQVLPDLEMPKPVQQQNKKKEREPPYFLRRSAQRPVPRGVIYESPEKCTQKSEELTGVEVHQQNDCKSPSCSKENCTCRGGKEKEKEGKVKEEQSEKQPGAAASAGNPAPVSDDYFPTGLAGEYLLTPLNVLKQYSAQRFDDLVEAFFRMGEES